jgi:uncharacterized repeat protein (TIGR01451 family)
MNEAMRTFGRTRETTRHGNFYLQSSFTITLTRADPVRRIDITIVDDGNVEADETIVLTLSNPQSSDSTVVNLGAISVHTITIIDNDSGGPGNTNTPAAPTSTSTPATVVPTNTPSTATLIAILTDIPTSTIQSLLTQAPTVTPSRVPSQTSVPSATSRVTATSLPTATGTLAGTATATPLFVTNTPNVTATTTAAIGTTTTATPAATTTPAATSTPELIVTRIVQIIDDETVDVRVEITNPLSQPVIEVQLVQILPPDSIAVVDTGVAVPACVKTGDAVTCGIGRIDAAGKVTVNFVVSNNVVQAAAGRTIVRSDGRPIVEIDAPYIVKSVSPPFAIPGVPITWTILVVNPSTTPLRDIVITDNVPDELDIISVTTSVGTRRIQGNRVTVRVPSLLVSEAVRIEVTTELTDESVIESYLFNQACMTARNRTTDNICASVPLLNSRLLPSTGESRWQYTALRLILLGFMAFLIGFGIHRSRQEPPQNTRE